MSALPLSGVRVIELCWVWSGPLLGQLLADMLYCVVDPRVSLD